MSAGLRWGWPCPMSGPVGGGGTLHYPTLTYGGKNIFFVKKIVFGGGTFFSGTGSQLGSAPEVNPEAGAQAVRLLRSRRRTFLL